jgi:hypothetical protein
MKIQTKKWAFRLGLTTVLIAGLLLIIILKPILTYAHMQDHNQFTIFNDKEPSREFIFQLDQASKLLAESTLYNSKLKLDICLNDASLYPKMIQKIRGQAFAWGFYNKVVLQGTANYKNNYVELNGYKWNLFQLLAHEMVHCMQFDKLGFWKSNPMAKIPEWKWEGYAEYIARREPYQENLAQNIEHLFSDENKDGKSWAIKFADGTISPRTYYGYWLLVQYCIDVKKLSYEEILLNSEKEEDIRNEMMAWFQQNKAGHSYPSIH